MNHCFPLDRSLSRICVVYEGYNTVIGHILHPATHQNRSPALSSLSNVTIWMHRSVFLCFVSMAVSCFEAGLIRVGPLLQR